MDKIFLETDRLIIKYITQNDYKELKDILQDSNVMYAWEYQFTDEDVQNWIDKNLMLYQKYNLGYFIVKEKLSGNITGLTALAPTNVNNHEYYEISYILKKQFWHNGYAFECAKSLIRYAFYRLNLQEIILEIRPENTASRKVAERLNARIAGSFTKNVKGKEMYHLIYKLNKESFIRHISTVPNRQPDY